MHQQQPPPPGPACVPWLATQAPSQPRLQGQQGTWGLCGGVWVTGWSFENCPVANGCSRLSVMSVVAFRGGGAHSREDWRARGEPNAVASLRALASNSGSNSATPAGQHGIRGTLTQPAPQAHLEETAAVLTCMDLMPRCRKVTCDCRDRHVVQKRVCRLAVLYYFGHPHEQTALWAPS